MDEEANWVLHLRAIRAEVDYLIAQIQDSRALARTPEVLGGLSGGEEEC